MWKKGRWTSDSIPIGDVSYRGAPDAWEVWVMENSLPPALN
jgi:hypothetical protein